MCAVMSYVLPYCTVACVSLARGVAHGYLQDDSEVQVQLQPAGEPPEFIQNIQRHMVPPQSVH